MNLSTGSTTATGQPSQPVPSTAEEDSDADEFCDTIESPQVLYAIL